MVSIVKADREDLDEILRLQYLSYQSEAALFGNMDIPPLKQTIDEVICEYKQGIILKMILKTVLSLVQSGQMRQMAQYILGSLWCIRTEGMGASLLSVGTVIRKTDLQSVHEGGAIMQSMI